MHFQTGAVSAEVLFCTAYGCTETSFNIWTVEALPRAVMFTRADTPSMLQLYLYTTAQYQYYCYQNATENVKGDTACLQFFPTYTKAEDITAVT